MNLPIAKHAKRIAKLWGDSGLRGRLLSSGSWILGTHSADLAIRLASSLIMTRLLFPQAFGLMALVLSIQASLILISDVGIRLAIVKGDKGEDEEFLQTAWTVQILRSVALGTLLTAIAFAIALPYFQALFPKDSTFSDPQLPSLIAVGALATAIAGFSSVNSHLAVRRLHLRPAFFQNLFGKLFSIPIMVVWAIVDPSVWALMAGQVAGSLWNAIASHFVFPGPRMKFRWSKGYAGEMFHSGKWVMVSSAANFVTTQADKLLFAVLVTSSTLGLYSIALLLKSSVEGVLQRLHGNLSLPVLAETFRERPQEVRRVYYRFRMPLEITAFFSGGFLMVSGGKIVELLYDDRYLAAGWMLEILAFSLIMYPMQIIGSSFAAAGEIQKQAMLSIINAFSLILLTLVGYGLAGFAGAIVGVAVSKLPAGITAIALAYKRGWIGLLAELRYVPLIGVGLLAGLFGNWLIDVLIVKS